MTGVLNGRRILVVEDEVLVAAFIEDALMEFGAVVVGPAHRIEDGMAMARDEQIDAAVLDVNLNDQRSDPIAGVLKDRGIPYLLATGYGDAVTSSEVPVLSKPYTPESLVQALGRLPMN